MPRSSNCKVDTTCTVGSETLHRLCLCGSGCSDLGLTDTESNSVLPDNKPRTKANRIPHISVCTRMSTSALDRHTENELTDLVKTAQLAD